MLFCRACVFFDHAWRKTLNFNPGKRPLSKSQGFGNELCQLIIENPEKSAHFRNWKDLYINTS